MKYVCDGICDGFRIGFGYAGRVKEEHEDHKEVVEAYIGAEWQAGRLLGPSRYHCFPQVQVSPFGVVRWINGG